MSTKNSSILIKRYKTALSVIHTVYRLINSTYDLKDLLLRLTRLICQVMNARYCLVMLVDQSKENSTFKCLFSARKKYCLEKRFKVINPLERKIIKNASSVCRNNILAIPLIAEDTIGLVIVRRKKSDPCFDNLDQEILINLAEQSVIGIKNLQLYEEQQKIVLGSIKSLVTLFDTRVPQAYTHSPHFSQLVLSIAHQMNLDEKELRSLEYASLLHDAGKVDIPMEILTKPEKLTVEEYQIIKRHPEKGAKILRSLQVLKPAIPIILHHHEKFDGTGYPSRLKKNKIPLGARVMAVADAFEAMVYGRPYRERINIENAVREIKKNSGTQFDPKVVEAFLKVVKKIRFKKYLH
ncbi:MAG: HD domain-containing phosphohydrolase [Candidatus Omnitrophota bacterium]